MKGEGLDGGLGRGLGREAGGGGTWGASWRVEGLEGEGEMKGGWRVTHSIKLKKQKHTYPKAANLYCLF